MKIFGEPYGAFMVSVSKVLPYMVPKSSVSCTTLFHAPGISLLTDFSNPLLSALHLLLLHFERGLYIVHVWWK